MAPNTKIFDSSRACTNKMPICSKTALLFTQVAAIGARENNSGRYQCFFNRFNSIWCGLKTLSNQTNQKRFFANRTRNNSANPTNLKRLTPIEHDLTVLKVKRVARWTKLSGVFSKTYPNDLENFIMHVVLRTRTHWLAAIVSYVLKALQKRKSITLIRLESRWTKKDLYVFGKLWQI